jgi:hypothetical protein
MYGAKGAHPMRCDEKERTAKRRGVASTSPSLKRTRILQRNSPSLERTRILQRNVDGMLVGTVVGMGVELEVELDWKWKLQVKLEVGVGVASGVAS